MRASFKERTSPGRGRRESTPRRPRPRPVESKINLVYQLLTLLARGRVLRLGSKETEDERFDMSCALRVTVTLPRTRSSKCYYACELFPSLNAFFFSISFETRCSLCPFLGDFRHTVAYKIVCVGSFRESADKTELCPGHCLPKLCVRGHARSLSLQPLLKICSVRLICLATRWIGMRKPLRSVLLNYSRGPAALSDGPRELFCP